jgi:hypothetical protein
MSLFALLRRNVGYSIAASALQLLSTLATVRMAGASAFADLTVDVFKLAVITIFLELVPTPYATFRVQRDPDYARQIATFSLVSCLFCLLAWAAVAGAGLFSNATIWMAPYALYLGMQRYLDITLQADNRIREYYQMLCVAAALRLLFTVVGLATIKGHDVAILWGALSLSSILSVMIWFAARPSEFKPFLRRGHRESLSLIFAARGAYYAYYLNTGLKRLRDSLLPVAASFVVAEKVELARYLLAMRGVEFVMGQLRLAEALLANLGNRAAVHHRRGRQLLLLAVLAQAVSFLVCVFLAGQAGFNVTTLIVSAIASLFAYPYVLEIGYRSDAYAEDAPLRVTISFAAFTATLAAALLALSRLDLLVAPGLIAAPVLAQAVASLTYLASRRMIRGRYPPQAEQ